MTARSPPSLAATLRHRKPQLGLPCTSSTGRPAPCSMTCMAMPSPVATRYRVNGSMRASQSGSGGAGSLSTTAAFGQLLSRRLLLSGFLRFLELALAPPARVALALAGEPRLDGDAAHHG